MHQSHVDLFELAILVDNSTKVAVPGADDVFRYPPDRRLCAHPVADEIGNRPEFEAMRTTELQKIRKSRHGAIGVQNLADHAGGFDTGQPRKVHSRLGVTRTGQYTAGLGHDRKHMSRTHNLFARRIFTHRGTDRVGAVSR